jgi:Family of unknown function (DUF5691)
VSSEWDDLVTAALIGTDRRPRHEPADLLDRAAVLTAARRAGRLPGRLPGRATKTAVTAAEDPRPAVGAAAAERLARMLRGTRSDLLPEWLTATAACGKRPPDQSLPALLGLARATPTIRPLLVANPRARWLATLNPDWRFPEFITADTPELWRLGTLAERRGYLTALRGTDPAAARELIEEGNPPAAERAAFLAVLADRLSPDDEPLLERALDDRAADVRARAADLLTRLPTSRYTTRMTQRRVAILSGATITPPDPEPRDGVSGSPRARVHEVAARALLPPDPDRLLGADLGEWTTPLVTGWVRAAIIRRDPVWTTELIGYLLDSRDRETLYSLLDALPVPWPRDLTEEILRRGGTAALLSLAVRRGDPSLGAGSPGDAPELMRVLRFRYDMLKELDD